jgi:hypothetical protein
MDSIFLTYSFPDPLMTFVRPLSALITAIVAGVTHNYTGRNYGALSFRRYLHALDNACGQYSLYVCASASTPIAAALILKGMSPGNSSGLSFSRACNKYGYNLCCNRGFWQKGFDNLSLFLLLFVLLLWDFCSIICISGLSYQHTQQ